MQKWLDQNATSRSAKPQSASTARCNRASASARKVFWITLSGCGGGLRRFRVGRHRRARLHRGARLHGLGRGLPALAPPVSGAFISGALPAISVATVSSDRLRRCMLLRRRGLRGRGFGWRHACFRRGLARLLDLVLIVEHGLGQRGVDCRPGTSSSTPLGRLSSDLTKPRGSDAALTKSPDAPPRAPNPKRLSATRAACESRAIQLALWVSLRLPLRRSGSIFGV